MSFKTRKAILLAGTIRWTIGLSDAQRELVVDRGLAKADRKELAAAVFPHWNAPIAKVKAWRRELNKPRPAKPLRQAKPWQPIMRRRRVGRPPHTHVWTPAEDEIGHTLPQEEAAKKLGMSTALIRTRRIRIDVGLHNLPRPG